MKIIALLAATALASMLPSGANAVTLEYTIDGDGHHAVFNLPSNPTNFIINDAGYDFGLEATNGLFDGVANVAGVTFYANPYPDATPFPGGLTYLDNSSFYAFEWSGPQLYTGPESAPTLFAFGPTIFTDLDSGAVVTISARAVPEPSTWATMAIGFGLIGGAYRMRRRTALVTKNI